MNVVLVAIARLRRSARSSVGWDTFFFLCLISLVTTLHDRYQPVLAYRESEPALDAAHVTRLKRTVVRRPMR